jgi:hypothetical protein
MLKKLILLMLFQLVFEFVQAQKTFKYYLNDREISGYSICYFAPSFLYAINTYRGVEIKKI